MNIEEIAQTKENAKNATKKHATSQEIPDIHMLRNVATGIKIFNSPVIKCLRNLIT